jgi:hypothetical protein
MQEQRAKPFDAFKNNGITKSGYFGNQTTNPALMSLAQARN